MHLAANGQLGYVLLLACLTSWTRRLPSWPVSYLTLTTSRKFNLQVLPAYVEEFFICCSISELYHVVTAAPHHCTSCLGLQLIASLLRSASSPWSSSSSAIITINKLLVRPTTSRCLRLVLLRLLCGGGRIQTIRFHNCDTQCQRKQSS